MDAVAVLSVAASAVVPLGVVAALLRGATHFEAVPVAPLAEVVVAVTAVGAALAYPALPEGGLVVPPVVVVPVACLVFAGVVRFRPALSPTAASFAATTAVGAGLAALFTRGILRFGPGFPGHALRPPSLVLSSVALAVTALAFFPLGRATARGTGPRWPFVAAIGSLPALTVVAAVVRPYALAGPLLPVAFVTVAVLFGVSLFRLGHASALAGPDRPPHPPR
jgi:hypothetical protein